MNYIATSYLVKKKKNRFKPQWKEYFKVYLKVSELVTVEQTEYFKNTSTLDKYIKFNTRININHTYFILIALLDWKS